MLFMVVYDAAVSHPGTARSSFDKIAFWVDPIL
jgi:hypothetical protein